MWPILPWRLTVVLLFLVSTVKFLFITQQTSLSSEVLWKIFPSEDNRRLLYLKGGRLNYQTLRSTFTTSDCWRDKRWTTFHYRNLKRCPKTTKLSEKYLSSFSLTQGVTTEFSKDFTKDPIRTQFRRNFDRLSSNDHI